MKKKIIILWSIVLVVLAITFNILSSRTKIEASMVDTEDTTGKTQTSKLEILYNDDLPTEMILKVSSDSQEIFDTTYAVVETIVDTIKKQNSDDPIVLKKKDLSLEIRADIKSEGFTYPKDYSKEEMKEYLKAQGWNIQ